METFTHSFLLLWNNLTASEIISPRGDGNQDENSLTPATFGYNFRYHDMMIQKRRWNMLMQEEFLVEKR